MAMGGRRDRDKRLKVAVIGTGISGLSAAWLLSQRHNVMVYEKAGRLGGHSNTVEVAGDNGPVAVDTGFIVYNCATYPNLTAMFRHLGVETQPSDMSFAVSLEDGGVEYAGHSFGGLLAQRRNLVRPRFYAMLADLVRFYRRAPRDLEMLDECTTLGEYLKENNFGRAFRDDHLLPMAAAIWSAPAETLMQHPAAAFIRFCVNHGLLSFRDRPQWRTVTGGSRVYVRKLSEGFADRIRYSAAVEITRSSDGVLVRDRSGNIEAFDRIVVATHADEALLLLADPSARERNLLGAFKYERNAAVLHSDSALMPRRRGVWSSWNYMGPPSVRNGASAGGLCVTYWMNRLQSIPEDRQLFLTLNPWREPRAGTALWAGSYEHPIFATDALVAQKELGSLQGERNTWFCGAYFGAGFHEDGLKAGLTAAEELGGVSRPWTPLSTWRDEKAAGGYVAVNEAEFAS